jgi:hypothetical protein
MRYQSVICQFNISVAFVSLTAILVRCLLRMTSKLFVYIAYFCAELICCLVCVNMMLHWYHKVLKLRTVDISLLKWHLSCTSFFKHAFPFLFHFLSAQVMIAILFGICQIQNTELQPIIWLLQSALLIALSIEVRKFTVLENAADMV